MRGHLALIVSLGTLAAVAGLSACAHARRLHAAAPASDHAVAIVGRTLVLPIQIQGRLDPRLRARLDDGRDVAADVAWISVIPEPADPGWNWLAPAGRWTATAAEAPSRPSADGFWAAILELPVDAVGQGVWVGGTRVELEWLPDPALVAPPGEQMIWASPLDPATRSSPMLARLAAPESRDPFRRWRWRLAFGGLSPSETTPDSIRFEDPIIEALADSLETRWRLALAWLWLEDPALAEAIKRRLVLVVRDGARPGIPAWSANADAIDSLLNDLTNPRLQPRRRAERARAWLDDQPALAAWVVDDAGIRDGSSGVGVPTLALANLDDEPAVAVLTWDAAPAPPEMSRLEPGSIQRAAIASDPASGPRRLRVETPRANQDLVVAGPLVAEPPGLPIAPCYADWTLPDWLSGEPVRAADLSARLYAEPDELGNEAWFLYVECRRPPNAELDGELLRVWLGPAGFPSAILRADASGEARDERTNSLLGSAVILRRPDRWTALLPIPEHAIEPDRTLRLALERIDASSRRSCWPRPLLPWQAEPGRALIDLNAWNPRVGER